MSATHNSKVLLDAINLASEQWQAAFNTGNACACAALYEPQAVMHAKPFGTYSGTDEIRSFWQHLIVAGYTNIQYIEPNIDIIDSHSAVLSSQWSMNKAAGEIYKELWVLQSDGTAKLREDEFEAKS